MNYRKLYEKHYGPIPFDNGGNSYDIHHKDGNRKNNNPSNLVALSLNEHYNIHLAQGDFLAAQSIAMRMKRSRKLISEAATLSNKKLVAQGKHIFQNKELARKTSQKRVSEGTHPFQNKEAARKRALKRMTDGTHPFLVDGFQKKNNKKRVESGTHNMLGPTLSNKRLAEGTHPSQKLRTCPHCNKQGKAPGIFKWHFDKCSEKQLCL